LGTSPVNTHLWTICFFSLSLFYAIKKYFLSHSAVSYMQQPIETEAIVIATRDFAESDRLITLFTPEHGKIETIAKGAKKSLHRFVNALEPFSFLDASLVMPRATGFTRLDSVKIKMSFEALRQDFLSFTAANLCCELIHRWTKEMDPHIDIFRNLLYYLNCLSQKQDIYKLTLFFKLRLLALVGYAPELQFCVKCGNKPTGNSVTIEQHGKGVLCSSCAEKEDSAQQIQMGTLYCLRHLSIRSAKEVMRLKPSPQQLAEGWNTAKKLHCLHLKTIPNSYAVLETMINVSTNL